MGNFSKIRCMMTKEELENIPLPLSDKDYIRLNEAGEADSHIWDYVSKDVKEAYDDLMIKYFDLTYPENQVSVCDIFWYPPVSGHEEYAVKNYLSKIKLPLSDKDYKKVHELLERVPKLWLPDISDELDKAYDKKIADIYKQLWPDKDMLYEDMEYISPERRDKILEERRLLDASARDKLKDFKPDITQVRLDELKSKAEKIGRWALYVLEETEYWDPLSLGELTEKRLNDIQKSNADWLSENRSSYPPSGAEEVLRSELTDSIRQHKWAIDDDTAFQLESDRSDGTPIEDQIMQLMLLKEKFEYPLDTDNLRVQQVTERYMDGEKLQKVERDMLGI